MANPSRLWRSLGIVLLALTAVVTVVSGVGIYCAAFDTLSYPTLSALLPYQWLYQVFMVVTLLAGLWALWATVQLVHGGRDSYQGALGVLGAITVTALAQVIVSQWLRGKSMPNDLRLILAVLTLAFFFWRRGALRPQTEAQVGPGAGQTARLALIVCGVALSSAPVWTHIGHVSGDGNWASAADATLLLAGLGLVVSGWLAGRKTATIVHVH